MSTNNDCISKLALDVLNLSKNTLVINLRFMDRAISILRPTSIEEMNGIAVDGVSIYYDPLYVIKAFNKEPMLMNRQYLHMILHCVFQHFWIETLVNHDYWDLACDIAVEGVINNLNLACVLTNNVDDEKKEIQRLKSKVKYMTAEHIYRFFFNERISDNEIVRLRNIFSFDTHAIWYTRDVSKLSELNESMNQSISGLGEDIDREMLHEVAVGADGKTTDIWERTAKQIQLDLEAFSKKMSDTAGSLTQNLLSVTREKYDYAEFLKKFSVLGEKMKLNMDEFDYIFYTYGMELYENMPLLEPLEYKEIKQVKEFVIAIDTSGSTSGELVQSFVQKTYNILKGEENFFTRFNLHIVQCDSEIQDAVKITSQADFDAYISRMRIRGLGGTDFRPVFRYVDKLVEKHEFINLKGMIYFTDGLGIFPKKQPQYKVAVVYVSDGYESFDVPAWAIKLVLRPEEIISEHQRG